MTKYFTHPLDASNRVAGFGLCSGFELLQINYTPGSDQGYIIRLIRPDLTVGSEVVGVSEDSPAEIASEGHVKSWLESV